MKTRLKKIEQRLLELNRTLNDPQREMEIAGGSTLDFFEGRIKLLNKPILAEKDNLELERKFILDARGGFFWKLIWNVLIPICVSVLTILTLNLFHLN